MQAVCFQLSIVQLKRMWLDPGFIMKQREKRAPIIFKIDGNEYHLEVLDAPVRRNHDLGKVDGIIIIADLTA